jgi:hypothetical protein
MTGQYRFGQLLRDSSRRRFGRVYELWSIWSWILLWLGVLCLIGLCWFQNLSARFYAIHSAWLEHFDQPSCLNLD